MQILGNLFTELQLSPRMLYPIKAPFKNEFETNVLMHRKIKKKIQPAELHFEKCWEVFQRLKYFYTVTYDSDIW